MICPHISFNWLAVRMVIGVTFVMMSLLFSQGKGLECITCVNAAGPCSGPSLQCPSVLDSCTSITAATVIGGSDLAEANFKSCFRNDQCFNGSLNLGSTARITLSTSCCNTDSCNTGTPAAVANNSANGRQCFSCGLIGCSSTLQCVGNEDRCITASVVVAGLSTTLKGCATSNVCSGDFTSQLESTAVDLSCCEGNLCNSTWSAGHSVLLLFWTLLSVLLLLS
ncbi:phospholipase A2 inhibitor and Ly6/PLAUR domain-containing protein-like [Sardina pilchardus]|uniref:phospholipase A2 inhibitor and Ly6/PLAUR domain-containing protein-like n=1 Tax=Sardina pilchardus TaxID=27697 RepID=UPI002E10EFBC